MIILVIAIIILMTIIIFIITFMIIIIFYHDCTYILTHLTIFISFFEKDAFERLSRLELKGKEDREIARIIIQCCGNESTYNAFYAELAKILCLQHRQYKITFQFIFWDFFKIIIDDSIGSSSREGNSGSSKNSKDKIIMDRKIVNLARMLSSLISCFQLPLSIIKPIEITNAYNSSSTILFLSTLLLALFKEKVFMMIDDESYLGDAFDYYYYY